MQKFTRSLEIGYIKLSQYSFFLMQQLTIVLSQMLSVSIKFIFYS